MTEPSEREQWRYGVKVEPGDYAAQNVWRRLAEAEAERAQLEAENEALREIMADLTDPDDCWFDHHGYCQAHTWFDTDPPCPHKRAKDLLTTTSPVATAGEDESGGTTP